MRSSGCPFATDVPQNTVSPRNPSKKKCSTKHSFTPKHELVLCMARKRWTPQTEITDSLIKFREKRKWQLGFRRYVIEKMPSEAYAPYFGLDIETLRQWFELQFTEGLNWDNFGKAWQFDHIVPTSYFDFTMEQDRQLCWNFINIRVAKLAEAKPIRPVDLLAIRPYFQELAAKTGYSLCSKMLEKLHEIETQPIVSDSAMEQFILKNKNAFENILTLDTEEFNRLNQGTSLADILLEREILRKFSARPNG